VKRAPHCWAAPIGHSWAPKFLEEVKFAPNSHSFDDRMSPFGRVTVRRSDFAQEEKGQ